MLKDKIIIDNVFITRNGKDSQHIEKLTHDIFMKVSDQKANFYWHPAAIHNQQEVSQKLLQVQYPKCITVKFQDFISSA